MVTKQYPLDHRNRAMNILQSPVKTGPLRYLEFCTSNMILVVLFGVF